MIITRTPFRVSFFGGGTDYPDYYREHGGAVLNASINRYNYITCRWLPPFFDYTHRIRYFQMELVNCADDIAHPSVRNCLKYLGVERGIEMVHASDIPAMSGIGSSSSFTVGFLHALHALRGELISKKALATQAIQVEQDLSGEHVGSQDQTAVSFGGFNRIDFLQNGEILVTPVTISPEKLNRLKDSLLLCFTGFSRIASNVAREKIRRIPSNLTELKVMHGMVDEAMKILGGPENSLDDFGKLLHESWQLKRGLASNVSNKVIDEIYDKARAEGALGGKICGAGDGGFMLLFAPKDRHPCIRKALSKFLFVPFQFEFLGSHIIFNTNQEDPWGDASGQLTSPCAPMVL